MKAPARKPQLILDRSTCFVVPLAEPYSVKKAARAVIQDVKEAGGFAPRYAESRPADAKLTIVVESNGKLAGRYGITDQIQADETFAIRVLEHEGKPTILITGNGERGAIFGLYHFSETQLGTDPFKHITGYRPPRRRSIVLENVNCTCPPHTFKFRGWHTECNVSRWKFDQGLERAYWERLLETLLRCKGNMIKAEVNKAESMQVYLSQKMGLLITLEHAEPLGMGNWDIESDEPGFNYSFDDHPHVFLQWWEESILRFARPENVIWTLGFRGRGDRPFWESQPERYNTDAKRGALITRVIEAQKRLVEKHCGHLKPSFIFNAWMEGNRLLSHGHIRLPEGVHTVWSNNGYGSFRSMIAEGCRPDQIAESLPPKPTGGMHGTYYHIAVGDGNATYLTKMVPAERIEQQFKRVVAKELTAYVLVNVGQITTCVMSVAAMADMWNHTVRWTDPAYKGSDRGAAGFMRRWCRRYFGEEANGAVQSYRELFASQMPYGEWGGWDDYVIGDHGYARLADQFVRMTLNQYNRKYYENLPRHSTSRRFFLNRNMTLPEMLSHWRGKTVRALTKWEKARKRATAVLNRLEGQPGRFFDTDILAQIEVHQQFTLYLQRMIDAVESYEQGFAQSAKVIEHCRAAQEHIRQVYEAIRRCDYGRWNEAMDWEIQCRYGALPKAWYVAEMFVTLNDSVMRRRYETYLNTTDLPDTEWIDTWNGPRTKYPFERKEVDRVLTPGERAMLDEMKMAT